MELKQKKLNKSCNKELAYILKKESAVRRKAEKEPSELKTNLTGKIPEKVSIGLRAAFCKAFAIVFQNGTAVIEKTYKKETIEENHKIQDYSVKIKCTRGELKRMRKMAEKSHLVNSALTTAEGAGLGLLGIGMPDIVVFIGVLLRGAYECAMQYGYDCSLPGRNI